MKMTENEQRMIQFAAGSNPEAVDFLLRACSLFHAVDDLVDDPNLTADRKIATVIAAMDLYGHPFFMKYPQPLNAAIRMCASTWADSVEWEQSEEREKRVWADVLRHAGIELIAVVADIVGGWAHRRAVSLAWREYVQVSEQQEREVKA